MSGNPILLVRHGESEGNRTRTFTDSPDVPITPLGREQARRAAAFLAGTYRAVRLITSPYRRAHQTAEILGRALGLAVEVDDRAREQSMGELAGRPYDEARTSPGLHAQRPWLWRPPGGESLVDVQQRVIPLLAEITASTPGGAAILVCHAGVIWAAWAHAANCWERARSVPNGAVVELWPGTAREPRLVWAP